MPLEVRAWTCPHCGTHHDRDGNAATHIRAEGIRIQKTDGTAVWSQGGEVRPKVGRKSVLRHSPARKGSSGCSVAQPGVVHCPCHRLSGMQSMSSWSKARATTKSTKSSIV